MTFVDNLRSIGAVDRSTVVRVGIGAVAGILLVGFLALGMTAAGVAQDDDGPTEFLEENVTKHSDDDPLEIEVSFADEFTEGDDGTVPETAAANVLFYDADEYANESDGAAIAGTDEIEGQEGQTISSQFDVSDFGDLEYGEEYTVVVEGDDELIDDAERVDGLLGGIGSSDGSPGFGIAVAAVALLAAIGMAARER